MLTNKKRLKQLGLSALSVAALSGCILTSATFIITLLFVGPFAYNTTTNFDAVNVDLTTESDWQDNKDDIERIESIRFGGRVTNNLGVADVASLYISPTQYTSYSQLMAATDAYSVFSGMPVPANASGVTMTAEQTDPYLNRKKADLQKIHNLILFGQFFTYAIGENANFDLLFEDCVYHIAFTAAK